MLVVEGGLPRSEQQRTPFDSISVDAPEPPIAELQMSLAEQTEIHESRLTPAVRWLITASVVVAFLQLVVVREPDLVEWLGFSPQTFDGRWWTPFTYPFVHGSLWLLALNVYALALFGPRLEQETSGAELARYFILCGLGGVLAQVLFFRESLLIGGSAAVFGLMLAYARRWPDDVMFLFAVVPVRASWLAAGLAGTGLVIGLGSETTVSGGLAAGGVAHLAHLGGIVVGWLYLRVFNSEEGAGLRPQISAQPDYPDETPRAIPRAPLRPRERREDEVDEIVARSKAAVARKRSQAPMIPPSPSPRPSPELDRLLDKISREGMESLSADERKLLEEVSKRLRGRGE